MRQRSLLLNHLVPKALVDKVRSTQNLSCMKQADAMVSSGKYPGIAAAAAAQAACCRARGTQPVLRVVLALLCMQAHQLRSCWHC